MFRYLPEQASDFADEVDWIHNLVTDISLFFTVAIVGAMIYFAIRYRRQNGVDHETPHIEGSSLLEVIWTVVPTLICIVVGAYGYIYYEDLRTVPDGAMTVNVRGQKWFWEFEYPNGKVSRDLIVPVDEPVKLVMTSRDVLHSFFIPAMRIKTDVVPGQFTYQWFRPIKTGTYQAFCTEYCGDLHSAMLAKLTVVSKSEYEMWFNDRSEEERLARLGPSEVGRKIFTEKGCNACHSINGGRGVGPTFLQLFGRKEKMTDGTEITVDEEYIRKSIYDPNAQIVEGYQPNQMPVFAGQLNDDQVLGLIAYIKTLDGTQAVEAAPTPAPVSNEDLSKLSPAERGKRLYTEKICMTCHSLDGAKIVGPTFKGIYGREEKMTDGSTIKADDAYIKESILNPMAKVVEGYPPAMPPYQGQLTDEQLTDLVEFLKTVK